MGDTPQIGHFLLPTQFHGLALVRVTLDPNRINLRLRLRQLGFELARLGAPLLHLGIFGLASEDATEAGRAFGCIEAVVVTRLVAHQFVPESVRSRRLIYASTHANFNASHRARV